MPPALSRLLVVTALSAALGNAAVHAQSPAGPSLETGRRYARLVIRNATIIDGNGTPAMGPADIVVVNDTIAEIAFLDPVALKRGDAKRPAGTIEIDATGKYVLPGLIDAHAHLHDERGNVPLPIEYVTKLWLACGITTVREVGHDSTLKLLGLRARAASGDLVSPRLLVYARFTDRPTPRTPAAARARVQQLARLGVDGIKIFGMDRDVMQAMEEEAHKRGLRVAHHAGVAETNAWDDVAFGTTSIEHWYGIPDAALLDGAQHFPASYNYLNETDRFRWAGRLWREADPARLTTLLDSMAARGVAWVPTLDIYEASRDLQRAQTQPWFPELLHPVLEDYFRPDPANHGSYFIGWTSTDEAAWKENYRIWMAALREFERAGGIIGAGDDAGYIYQMYGFGLIRELELHQEAGFLPTRVIQHATGNNARILGLEGRTGRVRPGYAADLIIVNGNPLEDLKLLYPTGVSAIRDGRMARTGGVEWTIKDGFVYHAPTLLADVRAMVAAARAARGPK